MKRIYFVAAVALILTVLIFTYSQSPQPSPQTGQTATVTTQSQPVKARKVLVKEVPKELAGITLENGVFKLAPGYKLVPRADGGGAVALKASGAVSGTVECFCSHLEGTPKPTGDCKLKLLDKQTTLSCVKAEENPCSDSCYLDAKVKGTLTKLAIF